MGTSAKPHKPVVNDMRPEYRFDYSRARPNRFAAHKKQPPLVVLLDPDVSEVFTTADSVNHALRALIAAMPKPAKRKAV